MKNAEQIRDQVLQKYNEIALQDPGAPSSCCGPDGCMEVNNIMTEDYNSLEGYTPQADLGLGCGLPTQFAKIKRGDTVIDLGSGAGNDCFIARNETGEDGMVIGIDFSPAMIDRAKANALALGFTNVEFRQGDIEDIPVAAGTADVVVSNCVLNLVPGKDKVFKEIFRILKPGGHFSISDIVTNGDLPVALRQDAEMYAGCVAGAIPREEYLSLIESNGFTGIHLQKETPIPIPDEMLRAHLHEDKLHRIKAGSSGIFSITVYAEKHEA